MLAPATSHASSRAGALTTLVGLGLFRIQWIVSWLVARLRRPTKHRVCGRKAVMQSDLHTKCGSSPDVPADRSGRPRFCKYVHTSKGCFDGGRPLADRVYHVSDIGKKCEKDQKMRGVHLPLYDHFCHWIGVVVCLDTIKPYLLCLIFLFLDAIIVIASSLVALGLNSTGSALYVPTVVLAGLVVAKLAGHNAWWKLKLLALENITIPEWNQV